MQAIQACHAFQFILRAAALSLELCKKGSCDNGCCNTVLIAHARRIGAETDCFLVAEVEARNAGNPLKARQRVLVLQAVALSDLAQKSRGDNGVCKNRVRGCALSTEFTQQRSDLVTGELTPTGRRFTVGDSECTAVSIGINSNDQVRSVGGRMRDCQVQCPRLFRVREGDGREIRIRIGLFGNQSDIGEAGFF